MGVAVKAHSLFLIFNYIYIYFMKSLNNYISEKLIINKNFKVADKNIDKIVEQFIYGISRASMHVDNNVYEYVNKKLDAYHLPEQDKKYISNEIKNIISNEKYYFVYCGPKAQQITPDWYSTEGDNILSLIDNKKLNKKHIYINNKFEIEIFNIEGNMYGIICMRDTNTDNYFAHLYVYEIK